MEEFYKSVDFPHPMSFWNYLVVYNSTFLDSQAMSKYNHLYCIDTTEICEMAVFKETFSSDCLELLNTRLMSLRTSRKSGLKLLHRRFNRMTIMKDVIFKYLS